MPRQMKTWHVYWSPTGQKIATVTASTARAAKRKAPQPYRKYLGEIYVEEVAGASKSNPRVSIPAGRIFNAQVRRLPNGQLRVHIIAPSRHVNNPRKRTTRDEYILLSNYGYGWEEESATDTLREMRQLLREYRENAPQGQYKYKKVRVKITE